MHIHTASTSSTSKHYWEQKACCKLDMYSGTGAICSCMPGAASADIHYCYSDRHVPHPRRDDCRLHTEIHYFLWNASWMYLQPQLYQMMKCRPQNLNLPPQLEFFQCARCQSSQMNTRLSAPRYWKACLPRPELALHTPEQFIIFVVSHCQSFTKLKEGWIKLLRTSRQASFSFLHYFVEIQYHCCYQCRKKNKPQEDSKEMASCQSIGRTCAILGVAEDIKVGNSAHFSI